MTEQEQSERAAVVEEAKTWLNTPYILNAEIKGAGVDCGRFLVACFTGTGLVEAIDYGTIMADFNLHRNDEIYLRWVSRYCRPVQEAQPGDIILYRKGRIISHGALVIDYPRIIHAEPSGVIWGDATDAPLATRQAGIFSFWGERQP